MTALRVVEVAAIRGRGTVIFARFVDEGLVRSGDAITVPLRTGDVRTVAVRSIDVAPRVAPPMRAAGPVIAILVEGVAPDEIAIDALLEVPER